MRRLLLAAMLMFAASPGLAERLITQVSQDEVSITSSFAGQTLTLFGSIEPDVGTTAMPTGPYHVIITITGPLQTRVARHSQPVFGVWMNTEQAVFPNFPSYYHVLSSAPLTDITTPDELDALAITPEDQVAQTVPAPTLQGIRLGRELIRLMTEENHVGVNPTGVVFRSSTLYAAQVTLPSDVPPGPYLAHTYLFKNGQLIAERSEGFSVRKIGFERFLGQSATDFPLLYGIVCVILALFTGWLGGVVFRR
jgi:uncharacterized protein (TIGR02186 family)